MDVRPISFSATLGKELEVPVAELLAAIDHPELGRWIQFPRGLLLSPGAINVRLAAVRRLAYEAADSGLLSPELAAGIRRVKGAQKLGVRLGNWLTAEEARRL